MLIAGNWKMHTSFHEAKQIAKELQFASIHPKISVVLIPPNTHLHIVSSQISQVSNVFLGAQNCHYEVKGPYTGEVSAQMLREAGCRYVIVGHSERRQMFHEDEAFVLKKLKMAILCRLIPIYCCGEPAEERLAARHFDYVKAQLDASVLTLSEEEIKAMVIAYEPIWAIGTGNTASPEQAKEMHDFIRLQIELKYGKYVSNFVQILYGGSVKASNAHALFAQEGIDGALVGGASLDSSEFISIIESAQQSMEIRKNA